MEQIPSSYGRDSRLIVELEPGGLDPRDHLSTDLQDPVDLFAL